MQQQTKQAQQIRRALPSIIGFAGFRRSGKDTLADHLVMSQGYVKVAFADAIRAEVQARYNVERVLGAEKDDPHPSQRGASYRDLLLAHGAGRRSQRATYWVDCLAAAVHPMLDNGKRVVISDVRMPDEIAWIRANGGVVVWVDRDGVASNGDPTEVDHYESCDYGILNDGAVQVLIPKLVDMIMENPSYQDTKSTGRPPRLAIAPVGQSHIASGEGVLAEAFDEGTRPEDMLSVMESLVEFMNSALTGTIHEDNRVYFGRYAMEAMRIEKARREVMARDADTVVIDLKHESYDAIADAVKDSPWVPKEYFMNEVVSDICAWLREPRLADGTNVPATDVGLRYYAVTGRIPGDDEDTVMVFQADDREHAIEQFKDAMWSGHGDEDDRASMEGEHGTDTYINSVLVSDTPIEEA